MSTHPEDTDLRSLTRQFPQPGRIEIIYLRPQRRVATVGVDTVLALASRGLEGRPAAPADATAASGR